MNANEKQQFRSHWEKVRRRGMALYLLGTAVAWGTFSAIFLRFVFVLLEHNLNLETLQSAYRTRDFLDFWGWCLLAGLLLGLALWFFYQWQFKRVLRDEF